MSIIHHVIWKAIIFLSGFKLGKRIVQSRLVQWYIYQSKFSATAQLMRTMPGYTKMACGCTYRDESPFVPKVACIFHALKGSRSSRKKSA